MPQGLISRPISPRQWIMGSGSPLEAKIACPDGDWTKYLPTAEYQYRILKNGELFDSWACTNFSSLNCLEIYEKYLGRTVEYSDRFSAKASGTVHKVGNYLDQSAYSIVVDGFIDENKWQFDAYNYYATLPNDIKEQAKANSNKWNWQWVERSQWEEAIKYAPIQIAVNGKHNYHLENNSEKIYNHAVTLVKYSQTGKQVIFDHYAPTIKELANDYNFMPFGIQYLPINQKTMQVENNVLYALVESVGGFALGLDGRLIVDDLAKILAVWSIRNNGDTKGKVKSLKLADWNSVDHIDLKGHSISTVTK